MLTVKLPAIEAAPKLLGCQLVRHTSIGTLSVKIVETEAYNQDDPASHSFRGLTKRTAPMFKAGGYLYVYFTYGMHYCLNIVVGQAGRGEAVLIRAAEPLEGTEIMMHNRGTDNVLQLTNGPGKLTQALGIRDTKLSGHMLGKESLELLPPAEPMSEEEIGISARIGITKATDQLWRFYINDNRYVSRQTIST